VLSWRTFMRLEVIEGGGREIHLIPDWFRTPQQTRHRRPVWAMIAKELRLQQLTFVMAGVYVTGEVVRSILERGGYIRANEGLQDVMIPIYFGAIALVAGSLASAEERHHGMIEAQLLVPIGAHRQWAIKAGIAVTLAIVLGLGVPMLLATAGGAGPFRTWSHNGLWALVIVALTACGLYVSSLSTNAARALMLAGPLALGLHMLVVWFVDPQLPEVIIYGGGSGVVGLLIALSGVNHRQVDRSYRRTALQVSAVAALIAVGLPALTSVLRLFS